jgi:hypothetical protein
VKHLKERSLQSVLNPEYSNIKKFTSSPAPSPFAFA